MSSVYKHNQSPPGSKVISIKPLQKNNSSKEISNKSEESETASRLDKAYQELEATKKEAQRMIDEANLQVKQQKQDWETEKQQYVNQAKEEGYQAGLEKGKQAGLLEYGELITQAKQVVDASKEDYHSKIQQSEEMILELGVKTAAKILQCELETSPEKFLHIVKGVIKEVKDQSLFKISVHPDHYDHVLNQKDELMTIVDEKSDLSIYPDESLNTGSCIIESPFGRIDASIESQLLELRNKLHDLAQEDSGGP